MNSYRTWACCTQLYSNVQCNGEGRGLKLPNIHPNDRWFFQQLVLGIDYCHQKGVVNRDVKLENALLQPFNGIPLPLLKVFSDRPAQHVS